jgi:hypothetical protein
MRVHLRVTAGPHRDQVFTFTGHDMFLVGRSRRAHFRLPEKDEYFSRLHFMVEVNPPHVRLMDTGSKNGTNVNGRPVKEADLVDGDEISAGTSVLKVSIEEEPSGAPVQAPPAANLILRPPVAAAEETVTRTLRGVALEPLTRHSEVPSTVPPPPQPVLVPLRGHQSSGTLIPPALSEVPPTARTIDLGRETPSSAATIDREECRACGAPYQGGASICGSCEMLAQAHPQPVDGYKIVRELGRGGMGVVYLATRKADDAIVALKTVIPAVAGKKVPVDRFLREARILEQLDHPNIVAFRDMGESDGTLYFAMDFVRGTDAARLLKANGGPLPIGRAVGLVCQLLDALHYAHAKGFIHRDVKPHNLLVAEKPGRPDLARLADFGLAKVYQASELSGLTMRGDMGGTIAYMAPEQVTDFRGTRPAADQYSAGATLYNLLTNKYAHDLPNKVSEQIVTIVLKSPISIRTRRPEIPIKLAEIIHRSLSREPKDRFPDVGTMCEELRIIASEFLEQEAACPKDSLHGN